MQVYLLRHGIAEDPKPGARDADRPLTAEGRRKLAGILKRAREAGLKPDIILTSPYLRARQTAELAAKALGGAREILETRTLEPAARPESAWDEIRLHKDLPQVLCCSHEPLCGHLASLLLDAPSLRIDYKKGALVCVDIDRAGPHPRGTLKWMLSPKFA